MFQGVIFDNTVFNRFARMESVDLTHLVKNVVVGKVIIPIHILSELNKFHSHPKYQIKVALWLRLIQENKHFEACSTYDETVFNIAENSIGSGEAGALAQALKRRLKYFITDDFNCLDYFREKHPSIITYSSFILIALADLNGNLNNYDLTLREYLQLLGYLNMNKKTRLKIKLRLREEYTQAMNLYDLPKNKKLVSKKTSLKAILNS